MINNRFRLPLVDPLLFLVQIFRDNVNLSKGPILNLGSFLMRRTVLDMVKVVFVGLHAYFTVGVLLVWDGLQ